MRRILLILVGAGLALFAAWSSISAEISHVPKAADILTKSPLAVYPGFGHNMQADETRFDRESLAREQLIARCMRQQDLPYTAVPPIRIDEIISPGETPKPLIDPNAEYAESLEPDERQAYYLALYGIPDPNDPRADRLHDPDSPTGGGCSGEAFRTIRGVYAAQSDLNEQYIAMRRSVMQDERVKAAEQRWSACMQDRGYEYASPRDLLAALDQATLQEAIITELTQQHQQAMDVADTCGTEVELEITVAEVRVDKETAFVKVHQDRLTRHLERLRTEATRLEQLVP
jgi:hypothetical protein